MWDVHPDRDLSWFEKETKNMSKREIAQELECNFNMSGETVFSSDDMANLQMQITEPKYRSGFDRNYWIWEEYDPAKEYFISADVARGDGKDNSVFHVFSVSDMSIVAEYQGKCTPDIFSRTLRDSGGEYGECMIVVENNSVGFAVLDKLIDMGYPNIYHSIKSTHEYVEQHQAERQSNAVAGFTTSNKTRPLIIAKMEEFVRNQLINTKSVRLFNEMKTFVWNNGKPQAMRSYNDDLIMSCAIGCWIRDTLYMENKRELAYKKSMLNSIKSTRSLLNTSVPGMIGYDKNSAQFRDIIQKKKEAAEFMWLYKG